MVTGDEAWSHFCEAEDAHLKVLERLDESNGKNAHLRVLGRLDESDDEKEEQEYLRTQSAVQCAIHAYSVAHPELTQVALEDLLRKRGRNTFLIAVPVGKVPKGMVILFGDQGGDFLDHDLWICTSILQEYYEEQLVQVGHGTVAENRRFLPRAGFSRGSASAYRKLRKATGWQVIVPCKICKVLRADMKHCGRCKLVNYCSKECQRADWKRHRTECKHSNSETKK